MLELAPLVTERGSDSDYVVAAVDRHPRYLHFAATWVDFWETVGRWTATPITPLVIAVDGARDRLPSRIRDHVLTLDVPVEGRSALIAQVSRLAVPGHLPVGERVVMTTDIDMMPLRPDFYDRLFAEARRGFVVGRDVLREHDQYPICYLLAAAPVWRELVGDGSLADFLASIGHNNPTYSGRRGGTGWFTDQLLAFELLNGRHDVIHLTDEITGHRRVDRDAPWRLNLKQTRSDTILDFADYHARTPPRTWSWLHRRILRNLQSALDAAPR